MEFGPVNGRIGFILVKGRPKGECVGRWWITPSAVGGPHARLSDRPTGCLQPCWNVPGWRNGRRGGLKIRCLHGRGGSSPPPGTTEALVERLSTATENRAAAWWIRRWRRWRRWTLSTWTSVWARDAPREIPRPSAVGLGVTRSICIDLRSHMANLLYGGSCLRLARLVPRPRTWPSFLRPDAMEGQIWNAQRGSAST